MLEGLVQEELLQQHVQHVQKEVIVQRVQVDVQHAQMVKQQVVQEVQVQVHVQHVQMQVM